MQKSVNNDRKIHFRVHRGRRKSQSISIEWYIYKELVDRILRYEATPPASTRVGLDYYERCMESFHHEIQLEHLVFNLCSI